MSLEPQEERDLAAWLATVPPEKRELLERRNAELLAAARHSAAVALMIRNFSHGCGKSLRL